MSGQGSRVPLPPAIRGDFQVFVNGVPQELGVDYNVRAGELVFTRVLAREQLKNRAWVLGLFTGIGTYERRDTVDVRYEIDGRPQLAHDLDDVE